MSSVVRRRNRTGLARWAVTVTALLAGAGFVCLTFGFFSIQAPRQPTLIKVSNAGATSAVARIHHATNIAGRTLATSRPTSISIPRIGVDSVIQSLGRQPDGSIAVPAPGSHYDEVGWYRYSPTPGSIGPAVLVGHVDSKANGPSIFYRLSSLRPNDPITIQRADGTHATFVVYSVLRFAKSAFPTQLVYGNTLGAELRLITCGGSFDTMTGHYLDNIVVLAALR